MRTKLTIAAQIIICLSFFSCGKTYSPPPQQGTTYPVVNTTREVRFNNLSYGVHAQQTLDLLLPAGRSVTKTKLLVLVHGGQWSGGDKSNMEGYISLLKSRLPDFAFANINYRLVNGNDILVNHAAADIRSALEYLWARTDSFKISKKTVLLGESAGGHLALLNAYTIGLPVRSVIGIKSPSNLSEWYQTSAHPQVQPLLQFITNATPATNAMFYTDMSPISHVTLNDPPTLLIHGDGDGFVNTEQSVQLNEKLLTCGVLQQLILLSGEAHAFTLTAQLQVYDHIAAYLSNSQLFR